MTNPIQPKPNPVPAILVYGTPSGPALTQASWFRAEDKEAVKAAAEALKFSVIELHTDSDRALAAGTHEGVLKSSGGRMIIGSVTAEVYRRIEEHVRKGAGAPDPSKPEIVVATTAKPTPEQRTNIGAAGPSSPEPSRATLGCAGHQQAGQRDRSRNATRWREGPGRLLEREARVRGLLARHRQTDRARRIHARVVRTRRDIRRSRAGPRTSPFRIPSFASRASSAGERPPNHIIIAIARGGLRVAPLRSRMPMNRLRAIPPPKSGDKTMTSTTVTTAERIRALNDAFRRTFVGGMVMITAGVEAMPVDQRRSLLQKVRAFDAFTDDNDPHGEHDFGAVDEGGVRCFWKIDYYDRATEMGSPDPADPAVTTRVLTIMRADEY